MLLRNGRGERGVGTEAPRRPQKAATQVEAAGAVTPCALSPVPGPVPLPPGVAAGPCPATGTERGRVRPSRSWPVGRLALPDGRSGPEGACRAGRGDGRRTR